MLFLPKNGLIRIVVGLPFLILPSWSVKLVDYHLGYPRTEVLVPPVTVTWAMFSPGKDLIRLLIKDTVSMVPF